jgi:hypothetical protein
MEVTDLVLVLFAVICLWIATEFNDGPGGGLRSRVPVKSR